VAIVVESASANATSVAQTVKVVVGLAPSNLLGGSSDGGHFVADDSIVALGGLLHLAVLIFDGAGNLLVVVGENLVVTEVRALLLVLLDKLLSACQVGLVQLEV
jgi:hypothetical protein